MAVRTPNTIRSRFDHVWAVIRAAVADRAIPFDITASVTLPRRLKADAAMTIPTTAQAGSAMRHASEQFTAFVAICAFGRLRLGEAGGLRVSDIDFMRRQVHVQRQVQVVTGGGVDIRPPKYGRDRWMFTDSRGVPLHQNSAGPADLSPINATW
jgi:integrase